LINVSIIIFLDYKYFTLRAMRLFLFLSFIMLLSGCTSIEVAKEVTKATASIKTSVANIIKPEAKKPIEEEDPKKLEKGDELEKETELEKYKKKQQIKFKIRKTETKP